MKSKTSSFNCGLFKSNLKRFWPIFAAYFVILLLTLPMQIMTTWSDVAGGETVYAASDMLDFSAFINALLAVIMASGVFGFMYNQRSCGMIASLPVKRGSIFATSLVSGIVPVIAINLLIALISAIPQISEPNAFALRSLVIWFAVSSMQFVFFFGFAAITAVITGSLVALPVFYAIFNLLAVGIESAIREIFSQLVFGFTNNTSDMVTEVLSPVVKLTTGKGLEYSVIYHGETGAFSSMSFPDWKINLIYCAVGILLMALALLLYRRRKMENCGDVVAIPALRPIFKYGVAICFALCFEIMLSAIFNGNGYGSVDAVFCVLYMVIGAFIGFFGSEMLLKKSFKVFKGSWGSFIAVVLFCILFVLGCVFDVFGVGDAPRRDDIESISICTVDGNYLRLEDAESMDSVLELSRSIIENKSEHLNGIMGDVWYVDIDFHLKNGHTAYRNYPVAVNSDDFGKWLDILRSDEVKEYYTTPDVPIVPENLDYMYFYVYDYRNDENLNIELTAEQAVDFFTNAYTADVMADNIYGLWLDQGDADWMNYGHIELQFVDHEKGYYDGSDHLYFNCMIYPTCENSMQWVKDNLGIDLEEIYAAAK